MQPSTAINISDDISIIKPSSTSNKRSVLSKLDVLLSLVVCIFLACLLHFIFKKKPVSVITVHISQTNDIDPDSRINLTRSTGYYDYEPYLFNNTAKIENKTRRFTYIDLGCFDGRDIDYFIHFHNEEISRHGTLNVIAFEPDPINFSACKISQRKHSSIPTTFYETAVWTQNGKVRYATEKGQKSKVDQNSALFVKSVDFSKWLADNFSPDDYVYVKFSIEGVEIPILEKMVLDGSLALIDHMEIEWNDALSDALEPRRVVLECMFDNYGMDFLYMINPVDSRHAFNVKDTYSAVAKDKGWKLKDPLIRFHYKGRKEVSALLAERLKRERPFPPIQLV